MLTNAEVGELVDEIVNSHSGFSDPVSQWASFGQDYAVIERLLSGIDAALPDCTNKMAYCLQIGLLMGAWEGAKDAA